MLAVRATQKAIRAVRAVGLVAKTVAGSGVDAAGSPPSQSPTVLLTTRSRKAYIPQQLPDGDAVGAKAVSAQKAHHVRQEALLPTDVVRIHERNLRVLRPGEQRLVQGAGREELLHTGFCVSRKEMLCSNRNDLQVLDGADRLLFLPTGVV